MLVDSHRLENLSKPALEMIAEYFRALGDATRLELLQHLALLSERGILKKRKQKLFVYYSLNDATLSQLFQIVCGSLTQRLAKAQMESND